MPYRSILLVAAALAAVAAGDLATGRSPESGPAPGAACARGAEPMLRLELLFGMKRPDGSAIREEEWTTFLDKEVTPRFPDGLTVLSGNGQWREPTGAIIREPSRVLMVWHRRSDDTEPRIEAIRAAWKTLQNQQSVMRVDGADCVRF